MIYNIKWIKKFKQLKKKLQPSQSWLMVRAIWIRWWSQQSRIRIYPLLLNWYPYSTFQSIKRYFMFHIELSKCINFTPVFTYFLSNIVTGQTSKIYQKLLQNNINACERSLVKIIQALQNEGNIEELESLLQCI